MKEVYKNLFVGDMNDCNNLDVIDSSVIVHACKTCHREGVGYEVNLKSDHPNYLIKEQEFDLYLNMVDMERELMAKFTNPIMKAAFIFIDKHLKADRKVLVHCDKGGSRGPSVAMLYLACRNKQTSYLTTVEYFKELYPEYNPGTGIELYMKKNFTDIMNLTEIH